MKKTSRRTFGKQLAAALAAVPVASVALNASGKGRKQKSRTAADFLKEHDTPPPVLLLEGSVTVETTDPFGTSHPAGIGRKKHFVSAYNDLDLAHIKIVDGSGEMLYRNDKPRDTEVRVVVSDGTEVKLGRVADGFYIDLSNEKDLGNPESINGKRKARYRPKKNHDDLEIQAIKVAESPASSDLLYKISKGDLNSRLKECRIMIWLE